MCCREVRWDTEVSLSVMCVMVWVAVRPSVHVEFGRAQVAVEWGGC